VSTTPSATSPAGPGAAPWSNAAWREAATEALSGSEIGAPQTSATAVLAVSANAGRRARAGNNSPAEGDVAVTVSMEGGRVVGCSWGQPLAGSAEPAAVTLTAAPGDAAELLGGAEPSVLFMQGRIKVTGDMGVVLAILAATATDRYRGARARLA